MEYVLSCLIVVICGLIGFVVSNEYVKKYNFYKTMFEFVSHLKINIAYDRKLLKENFQAFNCEKEFRVFLSNVFLLIEENDLNEKRFVELLYVKLKKDEVQELITFFMAIGKRDSFAEEEFIEGNKLLLRNRLEKAEELKNRNASVYSKLGIGIGLVIAIILI